MAERFDMSQQESAASAQPNLSELKKEVEITPSTLKDITNKEQFLERVIELSTNAKDSINIERAKEALVYLTEAEKILEYAASCGKPIDKYIIISVLHNQACCYQKIWELQKCSQYLEALIFNFNSFMKSDTAEDKPQRKKTEEKDTIQGKAHLAKYYLQFCAVNSQTDNHSGALVAGKKSIQILKSIFREMSDLIPHLKKGTYQKKSEFDYKLRLIELGSRLNDNLSVNNYNNLYQAARYYLKQWKSLKDSKDRPDRNYILEQQFKNYSIGNAMQIVAVDYKEFQAQKDIKSCSSKTILEKILLMALGYFTISTELRLIATKKYGKREQDKANSQQYKQSELYHLLSIIIASACIPFEILYIKHVLSSYSNHYGNDLFLNDNQSQLNQNHNQQLLFPPQPKPHKPTVSNSFNASLDQETISKFEKQETLQQSSENDIHTFKKEELSRTQETKEMQTKKVKQSHRNKSSKSRSKQSIKLLNMPDKSEKGSPMPKSPGLHMKSPRNNNNLIKVKTSYKLKVSAEKIVTTNNVMKDDRLKRKKPSNAEMEYFMTKSKDLKKLKKTVEMGMNIPSPRPNSRSSSRRQSPVPRYFDYTKSPEQQSTKQLKSPKRSSKAVKNSLQQHYF